MSSRDQEKCCDDEMYSSPSFFCFKLCPLALPFPSRVPGFQPPLVAFGITMSDVQAVFPADGADLRDGNWLQSYQNLAHACLLISACGEVVTFPASDRAVSRSWCCCQKSCPCQEPPQELGWPGVVILLETKLEYKTSFSPDQFPASVCPRSPRSVAGCGRGQQNCNPYLF